MVFDNYKIEKATKTNPTKKSLSIEIQNGLPVLKFNTEKYLIQRSSNLTIWEDLTIPDGESNFTDKDYDKKKSLSGIIDFGDMCISPRICEIAIAGAYIVLETPHPEKSLVALVSGFNRTCPLTTPEIDLIWNLLLMRLAVSVVNSTMLAIEFPNDPYVTVSQKPAWDFLENNKINQELLKCRLRKACGKEIVANEERIRSWIYKNRGNFSQVMENSLENAPLVSLAIENSAIPENPFKLSEKEAKEIGSDATCENEVFLGYYNEPRLIYTAPEFRFGRYKACLLYTSPSPRDRG